MHDTTAMADEKNHHYDEFAASHGQKYEIRIISCRRIYLTYNGEDDDDDNNLTKYIILNVWNTRRTAIAAVGHDDDGGG